MATLHCVTWSLIVVVSVFAAEIALRLTGRVTVESVGTAMEGVFERIPGVFAPGQRVVERPRPELRHVVSINSLGYRGAEIDVKEAGGRIRILCIGDAFTYGSYVDDDQTLPAKLERALRTAGYPVDVINAGVGGTTIVDQSYFLKKSARTIQPDMVVLVFSENDISDLAKDEPMYLTIEQNRKLKSRWGLSEIYLFARRTALFNFALSWRGWYAGRRSTEADRVRSEGDAHRVEDLWKRYDMALGEVQSYVAARGLKLFFVIFPSHHRIDPPSPADNRVDRVEKLAKKRDVQTINLLEPLRASGYGAMGLYLLPYDGHPSSSGYAVAAAAIARALEMDIRGAMRTKERSAAGHRDFVTEH
jgi:lysophospholipase L1-like esterase